MPSFEVKDYRKAQNGIKLSARQNGYFSFLTPQTQNFDFSKTFSYEIENFQDIRKTECMLSRYIQHACKMSKQYLYFCLFNGQRKQGKCDDVTF